MGVGETKLCFWMRERSLAGKPSSLKWRQGVGVFISLSERRLWISTSFSSSHALMSLVMDEVSLG